MNRDGSAAAPGLDKEGGRTPGHQASFRGEEKALRATAGVAAQPCTKGTGQHWHVRRTVRKFYLSKAARHLTIHSHSSKKIKSKGTQNRSSTGHLVIQASLEDK